ncbi:MAG TPA: hypothetical protein VK486_11485 [Thermoleophilaceae bacterium]|nr:hypothetical protein [Thermoleophilaceae bacterium]
MARWALALVLLLLGPSAAMAREPVISYVDGTGAFHLYDEELEAEVDPPPPVPANFAGFRYGMSHDGRYVVFNDVNSKLHVLDRATNTQLPLPGIDVYTSPNGLTVSNTGLIAFDDNSNGPALVYDSATQAFADAGLADNNGHRQTRLSGDGHFLASTCNEQNCVDPTDTGADAYVQDLATRLDTGFPADNTRDEEHVCINGDGSRLGFEKATAPPGNPKRDIFLFDRAAALPVALAGVNDANQEERYCVLDPSGNYLGFFEDDTTFRVYSVAEQRFLSLPAGKEFDNRSTLSAPYPPPAPPPVCCAPPPDLTKPVTRRFRMTHQRFRPHRGATKFRFKLSEPADVRIRFKRHRRGIGALRRRHLASGANVIVFGGRLKGHALRAGRYVAVLTATDAAGNKSRARSIRFTVLPPGGDGQH